MRTPLIKPVQIQGMVTKAIESQRWAQLPYQLIINPEHQPYHLV